MSNLKIIGWFSLTLALAGLNGWLGRESQQPRADEPTDNPTRAFSEATVSPSLDGPTADHASAVFTAFTAWLARYEQQGWAAPTSPLLAEGRALSSARRAVLRELIRSDPQAALAQRVPYVVRRRLPVDLQALLEEPIHAVGSFEVSIACEFGEDHSSSDLERFASFDGRRFSVFTYGRRLDVATKERLSINGIAVDDVLALEESPVRVLTTEEAAARGWPTDRPVVEVLGEVRVLANAQELESLVAALMADEEALGPAPAREASSSPAPLSAYTEGNKSVLYIICDFPNLTGFPVSVATVSNAMNNVTSYYYEVSYGKVRLSVTYVPSVVRLPLNGSSYTSAFSTLLSDARSGAAALGYDYASYDQYVVLTDESTASSNYFNFSYAGKAWIGSKGCHLVEPYYTLRTAGHELGHNFGLYHANSWRSDSDVPNGPDSAIGGYVGATNNAEWIEYGHRFSVMSGQSSTEMGDRTGHFAPREKLKLDWLTTDQIAVVTNSQTVRLYRYDHQSATNIPRAIHLNRASTDYTGNQRRYWLGYRRAIAADGWLAHGLQVDWVKSTYGSDGAVQLDMTPFSNDDNTGQSYTDDLPDKYDGALLIGRTGSDGPAGIHVTPVAQGGTSPDEWIDVVIHIGTFPTNHPPTLQLTASATNAATSGPISFTANATDPDGDDLAYEWDFGVPKLLITNSLNQAHVTNSWNTAGDYVVRCVASDLKGGRTSTALVVRVGSPSVYRITGRVLSQGEGIENVRIFSAYSNMTWSTSDGRYELVNLSAGSFTMGAQKYGYSLTPAFNNPVVTAPSAFNIDFGVTGAPAVVVEVDDSILVEEGGVSDTYVLRLANKPTNAVTLTLAYDTNQLALTPTSLILLPNDWLTGQVVTVQAVDDDLLESGIHTSAIVHVISSLDPGYTNTPAITTAVQIVENDINTPPLLGIEAPLAFSEWVEHAPISCTVTASDVENSVTQVVLRAAAEERAVWTTPPYTAAVTGWSPGLHLLTALAWDGDGGVATSTVIQIEVLADLDADGSADRDDPDDDGDGLNDTFEEQHFGGTTNGLPYLDDDEDGFSNLSEQIADTNPTNALSFFQITAQPAESPHSISVPSALGRLYTLQFCAELADENTWSNVTGQIEILGTGTLLTLTDPEPAEGRSYRLWVTAP
jgi:hypothetical protein